MWGQTRIAPKDGVILLYLILGTGGICLLVLEVVWAKVRCPETSISIPTLGAILIPGPLQFHLLRLWKRHPPINGRS